MIKCISCLLLINAIVTYAAINDRLKDDFFHIYKNGAITARDDIQHTPVTADKVTYYLFTKANASEYIKLDPTKLDRFDNTKAKIVFLIHGWTNSREVEWYEDLKNAFLTRDEEYYVIQVDWNEPAAQIYSVSSINTYDVAKHITDVIVNLHKNHGVDLRRILLVGHSLGGQICGFVGKHVYKQTLKKLPRVVALDPAGPLFTGRPIDKRLNKDDAEVVEVIHTDGGTFGFLEACGTIDFFINGGSSQPGCKQIDLANIIGTVVDPVICDHGRAWAYFTEAVLNPTEFVAKKCDNWAMFKVNYCDNKDVALGDLTTTATGNFFVETNKDKPFAKKRGSGFDLRKLLPH